jgi:hypothetical protein
MWAMPLLFGGRILATLHSFAVCVDTMITHAIFLRNQISPFLQMTAIAADNAFSAASVGLLAAAAAHCSALTHLDLSHCAAGDAGAAALAAALLRSPSASSSSTSSSSSSSPLSSSLRTLNLRAAGVGATGARALAAALRGSLALRLTALDVSDNAAMGDAGVAAIADACGARHRCVRGGGRVQRCFACD